MIGQWLQKEMEDYRFQAFESTHPVLGIDQIQMFGAGNPKSSIEAMKSSLVRHKVTQLMPLSPSLLEEGFLQAKNPDIFLKITNFIMIDYSPLLYKEILEVSPRIKMLDDEAFLKECFRCIGIFFNNTPAISTHQFLHSTQLVSKVKFVDELINLVVSWLSSKDKQHKVKESKTQKPQRIVKSYVAKQEEDQEPRTISVTATRCLPDQDLPKSINVEPIGVKYWSKQPQRRHKSFQQDEQGSQQEVNQGIKTKQFPIATSTKRSKQNAKYEQDYQVCHEESPSPQQPSVPSDFYQSQLNDLFQLVGNVSLSVNQLVGKFDQFQSNVSVWVKNINAKVDILQTQVKTIKDNL